MNEKETAEQPTQKRILILCVDRDGDLEAKAEIKTPLMGRTANLDAAVSLALRDPEEPDANAMFEAIRLNDRLQNEKKPEETFEVATISGSELGGVGADRKLVAELNTILNSFSANEVILVTDGYSDEAVLPLVESRVPVSSVRRIVIKHSESIEETAALFSKYIRLLMDNPRYSRIALGVPGILFFILGILAIFGAVTYYLIAIIIIFGGFMLVKGFGVDKAANMPPIPADLSGWFGVLPLIAGFFIKGIMDLMVVGIGTILFGRSIRLYFERDVRMLRNAALIVSVAWSRWILNGTADILIVKPGGIEYQKLVENLVFAIVVGVLIGIASVLVIFIIQRSAKDFFEKSKTKVGEFEES